MKYTSVNKVTVRGAPDRRPLHIFSLKINKYNFSLYIVNIGDLCTNRL